MAGTAQTLTFLSWVRPQIGSLVTRAERRAGAGGHVDHADRVGGRRRGRPHRDAAGLVLAGRPGGCRWAAARRDRAPLPGAGDAGPRIGPLPLHRAGRPGPAVALHAGADARRTRACIPWLVLVVGLEGSELTLDRGPGDDRGERPAGRRRRSGDPASAYRFAHVQQDAAGHRVARVLSGRPLQPGTDYLAVVVPAYDASGAPVLDRRGGGDRAGV